MTEKKNNEVQDETAAFREKMLSRAKKKAKAERAMKILLAAIALAIGLLALLI